MANDDAKIIEAARRALRDHKIDTKHAEALAMLFKATHGKKN